MDARDQTQIFLAVFCLMIEVLNILYDIFDPFYLLQIGDFDLEGLSFVFGDWLDDLYGVLFRFELC